MSEIVLAAEGVAMTFGSDNSQLEALAETTLAVRANAFVSIIGPSGCGKSTLLRILAGLVPPTSGQVLYRGERLYQPTRRIGYVFQHANLMPWRTVRRNIELPLELMGLDKHEITSKATAAGMLVGLQDFLDALPRELSGGMQQRVSLARALIHQPDVLLLDEPFGALDALTREQMNDELLRIWRASRTTVIMVTHNIQEAVFLSDRVAVMSARPGTIKQEIAIDLERPRSDDDLYQPAFQSYAHRLRNALR